MAKHDGYVHVVYTTGRGLEVWYNSLILYLFDQKQ